jgi:serine/threonine protein kinase/tetratricopeptide (TPR) repeat protein
MSSQRELVEELFEAALAVDEGERDAFLDGMCSGDSVLRRMVEDLLVEDVRAGSFLQHPLLSFSNKAKINARPTVETTRASEGIRSTQLPDSIGQFKAGQTLMDRFVVVRFIAKGGMGEVYEVEDRFLQGAHVALKTILPQIADDLNLQQRFKQEVLLTRLVIHPNLCPIYDIFRCEQPPPGFLFLTMKLLPGQTLAKRLHESVPISAAEGIAILKRMAAGLAAIHAAGIVHRDIKPNNVMLDGGGADVRLWITDFGLARANEMETTFSGCGTAAGTPAYMAPELFLGQPPSKASDLYAFGVVMHEVFTGKKPGRAEDGTSVVVSPRLRSLEVPPFCIQLITDCLSHDPKQRCETFERALDVLDLKSMPGTSKYQSGNMWTRRRFAGTAVAAVCAMAGGTWLEWDRLDNLLHPLPRKRFVALLDWPNTSDNHAVPMLTGVLTAIESELARAEAVDRDLFLILPEGVSKNLAKVTHLTQVCDPLGANLVLAASGLFGPKHFQLFLRLLDPSSNQPLRGKKLTCALNEMTTLPGKAVEAAASMLNLSQYLHASERREQGTQSPAAFSAFQSAESLMLEPNDTGLDGAIDKYKQAVELDPHYAIAHASLARAFGRLYALHHDPAAIDLARGNCEVALALNPDLVEGHLALALVLQLTGDTQGALNEIGKALSLDPSNARARVWQAQIYTRLNRWADAEQTLHRVLKDRPNYWLAYNELGFLLDQEGKYQESIESFRAASLAAPRNSLALSNLGGEYLQVGDFAEATECLKRSLTLKPDFDQAAANTSLALRYQGKYEEALPFAQKAVVLNPSDDANWLELGDCYSSLRHHESDAKEAYLRAERETERHLRTNSKDGLSWMLLALYQIKSGSPQNALSMVQKAESLGANDMNSQIYKARILELLGDRPQALATIAICFRKGASPLQLTPFPDLQSLRKDPRYRQLLKSKSIS